MKTIANLMACSMMRPMGALVTVISLWGCSMFAPQTTADPAMSPEKFSGVVITVVIGEKALGQGQKEVKTCQIKWQDFSEPEQKKLTLALAAAFKASETTAFHFMAANPSVTIWGVYQGQKFLLLDDYETKRFREGDDAAYLVREAQARCV